tara:strand:+ start:17113 stop:17349 length:237 start_codon:yes stop_codon:yes gene_type:complete
MLSKTILRKNKVFVAIMVFFLLYGIFYIIKPAFAYNEDGTLKPFGLGYMHKTIIPAWLVAVILGILCYYVIMVYFTFY